MVVDLLLVLLVQQGDVRLCFPFSGDKFAPELLRFGLTAVQRMERRSGVLRGGPITRLRSGDPTSKSRDFSFESSGLLFCVCETGFEILGSGSCSAENEESNGTNQAGQRQDSYGWLPPKLSHETAAI